MKLTLDKIYQPEKYETDILKLWEDSGFFNPDKLLEVDRYKEAETYTMILPPPNVTAQLHLGHAVMLAIQDLVARWQRMSGKRVLWLPGTDHAAIATQTVVEKQLWQTEKKTRHDLGRAEFLARAQTFATTTQATIIGQMKRFGASLDWSRLAFTMDEARQKAVRALFVQLYEDGLLYRGERVVNWCPRCQSTLSDDEIDYRQQSAKLYTFIYDHNFPIPIATTRPETKLGDTAIAVHPSDKRYLKYLDQELSAIFAGVALRLRVVADPGVDKDFGTGALGVTPAHSYSDWQLAQQNNLPLIKVIDEAGKIRDGFGEFSGLTTIEARDKVVDWLRAQKLLISEEEIENNLSVCYRCGTAIEPLPSLQWFVAVDKPSARLGGKSLKQAALQVVQEQKIKFTPVRFAKKYSDWLENLRDWCVSRQIWFGHQLPVWYRGEAVFVGLTAPDGEGWRQDADTLDTWFSSGMWTFSTLGWPDNLVDGRNDLQKFHPTQLLETGYDILTLWVSRMVMLSLFAVGEIPFEQVYLHGLALDASGKKMSKSKGNGIDPVQMIDKYGADALRLALLIGNTAGNDFRVDENKIASWRNFVNKFWNINRFILDFTPAESETVESTVADSWIATQLGDVIDNVTAELKKFNFSVAGECLWDFTVNDLADWYLECAKFEGGVKVEILAALQESLLRLWQPFMPVITEKIWQTLHADSLHSDRSLMIQSWPTENPLVDYVRAGEADKFARLRAIITAIRNWRAINKITPDIKIQATLLAAENDLIWLTAQKPLLLNLRTGLSAVEILVDSGQELASATGLFVEGCKIYLLATVDASQEKIRLQKLVDELTGAVAADEKLLANSDFIARANVTVVEQTQTKLAARQSARRQALEQLAKLK